jgi:hypothetical protein
LGLKDSPERLRKYSNVHMIYLPTAFLEFFALEVESRNILIKGRYQRVIGETPTVSVNG